MTYQLEGLPPREAENTKTGHFIISLPDHLVEKFGIYYYPLTQGTIDIFTNTLAARARAELRVLLSASPVPSDAVEAFYLTQLTKLVALAESTQ